MIRNMITTMTNRQNNFIFVTLEELKIFYLKLLKMVSLTWGLTNTESSV